MWVRQAARIAEDPTGRQDTASPPSALPESPSRQPASTRSGWCSGRWDCRPFVKATRSERICRDLSTYLRQPAPDEVLTEAACWFATHPDTSVTE